MSTATKPTAKDVIRLHRQGLGVRKIAASLRTTQKFVRGVLVHAGELPFDLSIESHIAEDKIRAVFKNWTGVARDCIPALLMGLSKERVNEW